MLGMLRSCARYAVLFYSPRGRARIAEEICGRPCEYLPSDLLAAVRKRYGIRGLLAADAVLFGWCFIAAALLDLFSPGLPVRSGIPGFLCCAAAFGMCRENIPHRLLKLAYLILAFTQSGPWLAVFGFLLVTEHIAALPAEGKGGGER